MTAKKRLGVGFIGSGFITRFHIHSWIGVRDADVRGILSPHPERAERPRRSHAPCGSATRGRLRRSRRWWPIPTSTASGSAAPTTRGSRTWRRSSRRPRSGRGPARRHRLREAARAQRRRGASGWSSSSSRPACSTATSRDQLFSPGLVRGRELVWARGAAIDGRPYLARAAEEHSGPHMPWFWQRRAAGRRRAQRHDVPQPRGRPHLLTKPGRPAPSIRPVKVSAQIASLKWSRPEYAELLKETHGRRASTTASARRRTSPAPPCDYVDEDGQPARRRGDDVVELRRRRACGSAWSCSDRSTRCR